MHAKTSSYIVSDTHAHVTLKVMNVLSWHITFVWHSQDNCRCNDAPNISMRPILGIWWKKKSVMSVGMFHLTTLEGRLFNCSHRNRHEWSRWTSEPFLFSFSPLLFVSFYVSYVSTSIWRFLVSHTMSLKFRKFCDIFWNWWKKKIQNS